MPIAVICDIHGNLPALEAVLQEIDKAGVDQIVCAGDVLPGPMPAETIARLQELKIPAQFITGNGDRVSLAQKAGKDVSSEVPGAFAELIRWTAAQVPPSQEKWLLDWPKTFRLDVPGIGGVLVCHATPRNDTEIFTRLTPEEKLRPILDPLNVAMVVCGHTHMQFDRTVGSVRVVNAGSVGMPFADPGAYWLLLGPAVELKRTPYDYARAADRIRQTAYPQAQEFAASNILQPPTEKQMLELFSKNELK